MGLLWIHFKAEPTASVDRLHVRCEGREGGEDDSETVSLSSFENGGTAEALEGIQLKGGIHSAGVPTAHGKTKYQSLFIDEYVYLL